MKYIIFIIAILCIDIVYAYGGDCVCDLDNGIYSCPNEDMLRMDDIWLTGEGVVKYCLGVPINMLRHQLYCSTAEHDETYMLAHGHIVCSYDDIVGAQYMLRNDDIIQYGNQGDDTLQGYIGIALIFGVCATLLYGLYTMTKR